MLSPNEFTIGKIEDAKPLSLILPTSKYEETMLVGQSNKAAVAVFLTGHHKALFIESEGNKSWGGLIIPDVRIEIDETSCVDAYNTDAPFLSVTRIDTRLVVAGKSEGSFGRSTLITLHDNLTSAGEYQAAFTKWQVVVGEGQNTRVVWSVPDSGNP